MSLKGQSNIVKFNSLVHAGFFFVLGAENIPFSWVIKKKKKKLGCGNLTGWQENKKRTEAHKEKLRSSGLSALWSGTNQESPHICYVQHGVQEVS